MALSWVQQKEGGMASPLRRGKHETRDVKDWQQDTRKLTILKRWTQGGNWGMASGVHESQGYRNP